MPGTVYTVASGKGGVGKTTTSVNLAVALWREGNAVALVDADIGMANLAAVLDLEPEESLHDVLAGRATVEDAIVEAKDGDLMVLPGDRTLDSFADADPDALYAAVEELAGRADYVIVDTGAGLSYEDVLPLGMADGVVLVTTPDPAAFGDTMKTMEVADLLGAPIRGLVVTRAAADTDSEAIAAEIGAELLGTVPEDPSVMASTVAGDPLESHAPDSEAAAAYRDLADALLSGDEEWLSEHARERIEDREPTAEAVAATGDEIPGVTGPEEQDVDADAATPATAAPEDVDDDAAGPPVPEPEVDDSDEGTAADEDVVDAEEADEEPPDEGEKPPDVGAPGEDDPGREKDGPDVAEDAAEPTDDADSAEADVSPPGEAAGPDGSEAEAGSDPDLEPREPADIEEEPEALPGGDASDDEGEEDKTADEDDESDEEDAEGAGDGEVDATEEDGDDDDEGDGGDEEEDGTDEAGDDQAGDDETGGDEDADDDDERSDDGAEADEKRGGLFGWLGRLFS